MGTLFSLGIFGLFVAGICWLVMTFITGYILGLGIWAGRPKELRH